MSYSCIKPWDTNTTLEATFRFIYQNQKLPDGKYISSRVYLATALKKDQTYEDYNNREEAYNVLDGIIVDVKENYFKIETGSICPDKVQICTVNYSDITNIISEVIFKNFDKYTAYMNSLPKLCVSNGNRYYDLLVRLKKELLSMKEWELLYVIYAGIFSLGYSKEQYTIIRNLIVINNLKYVESAGVIPITTVSGFFVVESKDPKEEDLAIDSESIRGCI